MAELTYPNTIIYKIGIGNNYKEDVIAIQKQLVIYFKDIAGIAAPPSISNLKPDGIYGSGTKNAVIDFQNFIKSAKDPALLVDGKVGAQTWNYLFSSLLGSTVIVRPRRTIKGQCKSDSTGSPLSGVEVQYNFDPYNSGSVYTDSDGNFSISFSDTLYFYNRTLSPGQTFEEYEGKMIRDEINPSTDSPIVKQPPNVDNLGLNLTRRWDAIFEYEPIYSMIYFYNLYAVFFPQENKSRGNFDVQIIDSYKGTIIKEYTYNNMGRSSLNSEMTSIATKYDAIIVNEIYALEPDPPSSLNTTPSGNYPSFVSVAKNLTDIVNTQAYKSLSSSDKTEILNHLRIFFKYNSTETKSDSKEKVNILWEVVPTGGGSDQEGFLPIDGITKSFKGDIGTINLKPTNPQNSIEEAQERAKLSKDEQEALDRKKDIINFILNLINLLYDFLEEKLLALLYKMLQEEFGISNPQILLNTLKNYKEIIKNAEERGVKNKSAIYEDSKAGILGSYNVTENTIINNDGTTTVNYISTISPFAPIDETEELSLINEINKLPIPNPPPIPNPVNAPLSIPQKLELEKEQQLARVNGEEPPLETETSRSSKDITNSQIKGPRGNASVDKKLLSDTAGQIAILMSFGIIPPFKPKCPTPKRLEQLIKIRNGLTTQLNNTEKTLNTVSKNIKFINTSIITLQDAKSALILLNSLNPAPAQFATLGTISTSEFAKGEGIKKFNARLIDLQSKIATIDPYLIIILLSVEKVKSVLSLIDSLIRDCSSEQNIPLTSISETLTSSIIDQTLPTNGGNIIKTEFNGFKLTIAEEESTSTYKRRYAQATDIQGVVQLRTLPSFSSNDQILINELIFEIESKNLQAQ
jgi:peptidoglycan hydrolase-like protein with peptidoglycan-binding domain